MITEDYVSFEIAKLLKEKGFEGYSTITTYDEDAANAYIKELQEKHLSYSSDDPKLKEFYYTMPTLQMAMKWLREVHKIYIDVNIRIILEQWAGYDINIYTTNINDCLLDKVISFKGLKDNTSYEQACEVTIKYCLENLI